MENLDDALNKFRLYAPSRQVDPQDIELAFQMQNATSIVPDLLEKMIHLYTINLYRWVEVLLFYRNMVVPSNEEILNTLGMIFTRAITHIDQFHGKASVSDWLFNVSLLEVGGYRDWNRLADLRKIITGRDDDNLSSEPASDYWRNIDGLPEKHRWPLILRYLFDLDVPDIAEILHIQLSEVHSRLSNARKQLLTDPIASHFDSQILAFMDGLLDENLYELNQLLQHLAECDLCQAYAVKINEFEKTLAGKTKDRWSCPPLSDDDLKSLLQSILREIQQPKVWWKEVLPLQHSIWILGLCVIFVGLAFLFVRMTSEEREFPQAKATAIPTLPPIIERPPGALLPPNHGRVPNIPQYIVPAFSSDGKWAVFAVIRQDPASLMTSPLTIELYNREANSVQVIGESITGRGIPWIYWELVPSISADGQWITYASVSTDSNISGAMCGSGYLTCLDIFIYNRESGQTRRITHSVTGGAANGDSFSPIVSADGQWVAFWSAASNLVDGMQETCEADQNISCLYVYLYDQISGKIEQIPFKTATSGYLIGPDRISLSADGRYVGFTVIKDMMAEFQQEGNQASVSTQQNTQKNLETTPAFESWNNSEAIVFDRETGKYELENQTQDGIPGNNDSYSPQLSADGRYVAFSSSSSNLVPGDSNAFEDVFVRDRTSGMITLISHTPDGNPGNEHSGLTIWSAYGLNISSDGRYIIYSSSATNISQEAPVECISIASSCNLLYLYDQQTGSNILISDPAMDHFSLFPQISPDGKWASFMQTVSTGPAHQYQNSDVMLYDRQQAWTTNLTKSTQLIARTPWSYVGSLSIPREISERNALAFSPDGSLLALAGNDSFVRIWRVVNGVDSFIRSNPSKKLGGGETVSYTSLAFSPDGSLLAAGTTSRKVFIWKVPEGNLIYRLEVESGPTRDLKFSTDGSQLFVAGNTEAEIWRLETNQLVKLSSFSYGTAPIYSVAISSTGNLLATARGNGIVWLQSIQSGDVVSRLGGNQIEISKVIFSADGNLLATLSMEGSIDIWQINGLITGASPVNLLNTFQTDNEFGPISISPDGRYLATSSLSGGILLWDVDNGDVYTVSSSNPDGYLDRLAFSGRGYNLAGTLINSDLVLWELIRGSSSQYFVHADWDNYGNSGPIPSATANDVLMLRQPAGRSVNEHLTLDQTGAHLSFPLLVPDHLPKNIVFKEASVNPDGSAWLEYDASDIGGIQAGLYIYEQYIGVSRPPTMTIGASAAIVQIPLVTASGVNIADYVQGDWSWSRDYNSQTNTHNDSWDWNNMRPTQRLRWKQQGIFVAIYYQVTSPYERRLNQSVQNEFVPLENLLIQQEMVQIAKGMLPFSELYGLNLYDPSNQSSTDTSVYYDKIYLRVP